MVLRVLYVGSDKWFGKTGCLDFWLNALMAHGTKVFFKVDDRMIAANPQAAASAAFLTGSADSLDASTAGAQRDAAHGHYARLMAQWRSRQGGDDPATVVAKLLRCFARDPPVRAAVEQLVQKLVRLTTISAASAGLSASAAAGWLQMSVLTSWTIATQCVPLCCRCRHRHRRLGIEGVR
jgi:hypothetical protein